MAVPKIFLRSIVTPLANPEAVRLWSRNLHESLGPGLRFAREAPIYCLEHALSVTQRPTDLTTKCPGTTRGTVDSSC